MLIRLLLHALAAFVFVAVVTSAQNCQHGLNANEIAINSGMNLTGKVALITGGRSGLGYAISEALLRVGCKVVIASRDEALNQAAVQNLTSIVDGADISYITFDLSSFECVRTFAADFIGNYSSLDYYFGSAGQGGPGDYPPITEDGYDRIFQVNYVSQVLLVELLLPLLREDGPGRILLTASSTHSQACGSLGLTPEDECFGDGSAIALMPFDQKGLDAINNTFLCAPLFSSYPLTKYLMTQLAREVSIREAEAGNELYAYSWAPGNINTDLNPFALCCVGPVDNQQCRCQLPYVGPTDADGNPDPPEPPVQNRWTSPAHGVMAAIYVALVADEAQAGSFVATYWECGVEKGYFPQGITPEARAKIYDMSKVWAGINEADYTGRCNKWSIFSYSHVWSESILGKCGGHAFGLGLSAEKTPVKVGDSISLSRDHSFSG